MDYSILIENRKVYTRGERYQARSLIDEIPDVMYVEDFINPAKSKKLKEDEEYFNLQTYIDAISERQSDIAEEYEY